MELLQQLICKELNISFSQRGDILIVSKEVVQNLFNDQYLVVYYSLIENYQQDITIKSVSIPLWGEKIPHHLLNKDCI